MPDLDDELLERAVGWCAEAGRATTAAEVRSALGGLSWDELLAVRALLADPPPARPLGPSALADIARGVPADVAAERERAGGSASSSVDEAPPASGRASPAAPRKGKRAPRLPSVVIRRARDASPAPAATAPAVPLLDELLLPEGRGVLERLIRHHGARRSALLASLAEGWRAPDGRALDEVDLERLLDHHGLARNFRRREHDELLHALRASGGLRTAAAARLGLGDREALEAALVRAGADAEAEKIREARRAEVRAKATLAERVRLLLADAARLEDLGVLTEVEDDLRRRLPEHLRAVSTAAGPVLIALGRSLSILPSEAQGLLERLGVRLDGGPPSAGPGASAPRARQRGGSGEGRAAGGMRPPRRPSGPRPERGGRPGAERFGPPRERRASGSRGGPSRERGAGGLGPPRDRKQGGFGPPRPQRDRKEGGFGPPRPQRDRKEGGFGPPRDRRDRGATGTPRGGPGGARPGRPGTRPSGPGRGKPPPRGPRRG